MCTFYLKNTFSSKQKNTVWYYVQFKINNLKQNSKIDKLYLQCLNYSKHEHTILFFSP